VATLSTTDKQDTNRHQGWVNLVQRGVCAHTEQRLIASRHARPPWPPTPTSPKKIGVTLQPLKEKPANDREQHALRCYKNEQHATSTRSTDSGGACTRWSSCHAVSLGRARRRKAAGRGAEGGLLGRGGRNLALLLNLLHLHRHHAHTGADGDTGADEGAEGDEGERGVDGGNGRHVCVWS